MAIIKTPDLGVDQADVSELLVKPGDTVTEGQAILVAESSKATVDIPAPQAGVIGKWLVKTGDTIAQGQPLLEMSDEQGTQAAEAQPPEPAPVPVEASTVDSSPPQSPSQSKPQPENDATAPVASHQAATAGGGLVTVSTPDLGVDSADVSELLLQVGDEVSEGQSLLVAESSKAALEVPSTTTGVLRAWRVKAGDRIEQGQALADIESAGASVSVPAAAAPAASDSGQPAKPATVETAANPPPAQPEKATPSSDKTGAGSASSPIGISQSDATATGRGAGTAVYAGPAVRRTARQLGVDLGNVTGTGDKGRLLKEDVYAHVKAQLQQIASSPARSSAAVASGLPPLPDMSRYGSSQEQTLTKLQQGAVQHLSLNSWIPQVTHFDQADVTELEAWRQSIKDSYKKQGVSLTILAFLAKAVAHLLKQQPRFNSHLKDDNKTLLLRDEVHLGIAVATPDGLIVPVLRNPDQLGIRQIAEQLQIMAQQARDKKLTPADLAGASFTISSLGSLGGTGFTPLVNWPQVAILGVSPAAMQPVWDGDQFQPRLMLPLSLSYDHRVINGADAAQFSQKLAGMLADMRGLLL